MPKGIAKKKSAPKKVTRKYTKRAPKQEVEQSANAPVSKTTKELIIEHLNARHIQHVDHDGHLGISNSQMVDVSAMEDLMGLVQAMNARKDAKGVPYIAIYY